MNELTAVNEATEEASKNIITEAAHETGEEPDFSPYSTNEAKKLFAVSEVFRNRIMCIKKTIKRVYPDLASERRKAREQLKENIARFNESPLKKYEETELAQLIDMLIDYSTPFDDIFIRGMFLSIFSELDAFTEKYLTALFELKPDAIIANQKPFAASEIFDCDSIEDFKKKVIQKEIDALKRGSYIEQVSFLEKTFNIETLRKFSNWGKYVEITQRRNIVVHNDGIISEQYVKICGNNNAKCDTRVGQKPKLSYNYLMEAISIIEEVSIKLTQTLWRKCFPEEAFIKEFDDILNGTIFSVLSDGEWSLAKELGEYGYYTARTKSAECKMMILVNYCIALNNLDERSKVEDLLRNTDFSIIDKEFVLAKFALLNDVENTIKLMTKIGTGGTFFNKETYPSFPLFSEIKKEKSFRDTYKALFGEDIDREEIKARITEAEKSEEENQEITSDMSDSARLLT